MTREQLQSASQHLESAADGTADDDAADRLADLAADLADLAEAEHGPDHGRMARLQTALSEVQSTVADDVAGTIQAARDDISSYRETVEGV